MDVGGSSAAFRTDSPDNGEEELFAEPMKDPRIIARKYQLDFCKKALEENIVVYLETGCGKTHIAVLLIYEMGHLIKKPQKNICIFLAPTVALVQQQARVIESSINFKVGICCGSSTRLKTRHDWEKEIEDYEVLVMTPQIMLHSLSHCFMKIELIALMIFDECHYAQLESNHPYAEIMKIFYKMDASRLPRIFGMTASPKLGKGGSIDGLETLLRAKVYSVEDKDELEKFVTSPKVNMYYYGSIKNGRSCPHVLYAKKLDEIKHKCNSELPMNSLDQSTFRSIKKSLQKLHSNIIFCLEHLGLRGALQATYIFKREHSEDTEILAAEVTSSNGNSCNKYLQLAASVLASDCTTSIHNTVQTDCMETDMSRVDTLMEPYFSRKLLRLIDILSGFRSQPDMKCIIFVNRIITARSLSYILQNLRILSAWKCDFLVGVHSKLVSRKNTNLILDMFRSGQLNLLVATKVGEEGLDIQTCCLVIRFDLPETVASFIQSRGRARMPQSEYAFLVDRGNPRELNLIEHFKKDEAQMNEEISLRKSHLPMTDFDERTYKVDSTGATISSVQSISLLHHYCSKLPHDEYFNPKPQFFYHEDADGMVCTLILPANCPVHQISSAPQPSNEEAKKDACLKACKELHIIGALTDYLLPEQDDIVESTEGLSDSDTIDGQEMSESRAELHEMLVPSALRNKWTKVDTTSFSSYYIKFSPNPADRTYRRFGLFLKEPLPDEAGKMEVDLCLDRGRMVKTQFVPFGVTKFNKHEIAAAEMFQKMFLKIILDRHVIVSEYVSLENDDDESSSSTFYLLLPVIPFEYNKLAIDWKLINRCLSSPIFRNTGSAASDESSQLEDTLHLANGLKSIQDVVNSLVYVPCKDTFFFISDIFSHKSGFSLYDDSKSHMEHYAETFNIRLAHPHQPLLKAKQLFVLDNLLRKAKKSEGREKPEHFIEIPPEICQLKVIGFSKDIGSSLSLLPSIMHRFKSFLVAIELKDRLAASFREGAKVSVGRILEALTTERCGEHFSLERLEVLGDSFLKFSVGRHLFLKHDLLDEGQLTRKRSNIVNNSNLLKLANKRNLQVYIRDQAFQANQFFALGRRCPLHCSKETQKTIHSQCGNAEIRCNKNHHWLYCKTIADVVEALTGAFIVDSGFKAATEFLMWIGIKVDYTPSQIDDICSASKEFLSLSDQIDINSLENQLRYKFTHKGLLIQAFIHPSYNNHVGGCYQRFEFLGDAVLDYLITSYLFSVYPELRPGHFTALRSVAVNNSSFADVAGQWSFHKYIICDSSVLHESIAKYVSNIGSSETVDGSIEEKTCPKVLGDLVESCMGAIYLDTGFNLHHAWEIMLALLDPIITFSKLHFNPLRELNELCQSFNWEVQFSSSKEDGQFKVEAKVNEGKVFVTASATNMSGKVAKRMAARQVFERLKAQGYKSKTKSLDEELRRCPKSDAKLIGYDERPCYESVISEGLKMVETSASNCQVNVHPRDEISISISRPDRGFSEVAVHGNGIKLNSPTIHPNAGCSLGSQGTGSLSSVSARSRLYEICAANCWKPPTFECCLETGPSHSKEFIFKTVMEIEEMSGETFEFYGEARTRKKDAAEHAAEGALWFLEQGGYVWDRKKK